MKFIPRAALLLLGVTGFVPALAAQTSPPSPAQTKVCFDLAGGMSKYGPHALLGFDIKRSGIPVVARFDGLFGIAPENEIPGKMLMAGTFAAVLPIRPESRLSSYLLGGVAVSHSRYLSPAVGPVGALGLRLRVGRLTPYVEARAQHRVGVPISFGLRF